MKKIVIESELGEFEGWIKIISLESEYESTEETVSVMLNTLVVAIRQHEEDHPEVKGPFMQMCLDHLAKLYVSDAGVSSEEMDDKIKGLFDDKES